MFLTPYNYHMILDTRARDGFGETYQNGTGFAGLPAPCSAGATCGYIWRLHAAARHPERGCALLASLYMLLKPMSALCCEFNRWMQHIG